MSPASEPAEPRRPATLLSLPPELHLLIALHLYSPLHLTQQDRLTWSVFSTVDMDPERWHGMDGLIAFAATCKAVRRTVRYLLFRCVRVHGLREGRWLIRASTPRKGGAWDSRIGMGAEKRPTAIGDDWGKHVHSVILDMAMFDPDQQQVQLDEDGRGDDERGDYDDVDESRRAVQTRVARWTTSVQTLLAAPSSGGVSPAAVYDQALPTSLDDPWKLEADLVAQNGGPTQNTPLVDIPTPDARQHRLGQNEGTPLQDPGKPEDAATNNPGNSIENRGADNPGRQVRAEEERLDDGSQMQEEEHEEGDEDEEEEWESFPLNPPRVRDPWKEASFLITMLTRLPSLHHLSIFADPSDDITLSLLFSHPAMLAIAPRLRSFGWRLRASPPSALREFDNSTMYVSIQGWLKECINLGFLVLDSDIEKEGVREVDLERVISCLGEGRERTVRRREKEAKRARKRIGNRMQGDPPRPNQLGNSTKRKYGQEYDHVVEVTMKRPRIERLTSTNKPSTQDQLALSNQMSSIPRLSSAEETDIDAPSISKPSNVSLMLCGPIQGWMLSLEAEVWAAENEHDIRTWMMETKAKVMTAPAKGTNEDGRSGLSDTHRRLQVHPFARHDELTPGPEPSPTSTILPTAAGMFRDAYPSASTPGPLLSPVSVLSSSYSPVVSLSGASGGAAYFQNHHNHFQQHDPQGIQPYIHHISSTPYQPNYAGIVPSYTNNGVPSASATTYPARPPLRSHSRSHIPLSVAERRKAALDNRPPVFLDGIVRQFTGIKELFVDRPVRAPYGSEEDTLRLLTIALIPLIHLPDLTLLQIGGYPLCEYNQLIATDLVVNLCPKILLCGWLGLEGETNWYGVWRDRKRKVQVDDYWGRGLVDRYPYRLKPMGDGDLFDLEEEQQVVRVQG